MTVFRDLTEVTVFLSLFFFFFIPWLASALLAGRFWGVNSCQEIQRSPFSSASLGKITLLTLGKNKSYEGLFSATRNGVNLLYQAHGTWHTSTPAKGTYTYSEGWRRKGLGWLPEERWKDFLVSSHSNIVFHMLLPIFLSLAPFPALLSSRSVLALCVCVCVCVCVCAHARARMYVCLVTFNSLQPNGM